MNNIAKKIFALGSAVTLALSVLTPLTAHAAVHAVGTNVNDNGTIWMIMQGNCRAAYTSAGAFTSYGFNSWSTVVTASTEDLALATCTPMFIPPQDGQIIVADRGAEMNTAFFVSGGQKRGFVSRAVYDGSGFPGSRLFGAGSVKADVSWMTKGANIETADAAHLPGALVHYVTANGHDTTFLVGATGLLGIPDLATFQSWGFSFANSVVANAADKLMVQNGVMASRLPGQLSPTALAACTSNCGPVVSGPLTVSLSNDNPASSTLVANQATADLAHFTFTGTGTLSSVTFQRIGVSNNTVFDNVYLYEGNTRITDSASVNSTGVITFTNLNWAVTGSRTVSVRADINSGATSGTVGVNLTAYTVTGSTTANSVNLSGNLMSVVSGSGVLGTVNVGANTLGSTQNVDAGATQYTFWNAAVTVGTHAMWLKSMALHYIGSAPNDALSNIKLYNDGTPIATSTGVNAQGYVVFDLGANPLSIATGSHTFDVRADVQKGSSRTVQLSLQNKADIMMTDSQANINVGASSPTAGSFSTQSGPTVTINTGTVSVNVDPAFQALTNVTGGATNAVIGKFTLHAYGEDVKVNTLYVKPTLASQSAVAAAGLNNVALFFNGSQIGSSVNMTSATTQYLTFNLGSSLIIPAGVDSHLEVHADLTTYSTNLNYTDGTVAVMLTGNGGAASGSLDNAQGLNSLVSTIDVPAADKTTSGLTIQTGVIAIAANPAFAAQSVNPNTQNAKIGSYIIQNQSSSEGVRVTNLNVGLVLTTVGSTNYSNLKTSETSGSGAIPINPTSAAAAATSSNNFPVNFVLAPGETKVLDIFADVGSSTGSLTADLLITAIGASSNVTLCSSGLNTGTVAGCNVGPGTRATGQVITIQTGTFGNAGLVVSSSSAPQYVAAGGTSAVDATKATFNFKSVSGSATISELKFNVTTSTGISASSVRVGTVTGTVIGGVAYLTGLNIAVPNGGSGINVDAFITYGPVGTNGNTSGAESFAELTYIKYNVGGTTGTTTGGQSAITSNTQVATTSGAANNLAAVGSTATIVFASTAALQPGMILAIDNTADSIVEVQSVTNSTDAVILTLFQGTVGNATKNVYFFSTPQIPAYASSANNCSMTMSDAGVTVAVGGTSGTDCMSIVGSKPTMGVVDVNTTLTNGLVKLGQVTVNADSHGDIALNALPLSVTSTGVTTIVTGANNIVVKNAADNSTANTTNTGLAVSAGANGTDTINFTGGYTVTGGSTITFDIYVTAATVSGAAGSTSLSMQLGTAGSLTWTDLAGNGSTGAETGAIFLNYPTNASVITNQ